MLHACIRTSSTKNVNKHKRKCMKMEIIMLRTGMTCLPHTWSLDMKIKGHYLGKGGDIRKGNGDVNIRM